MAFFFIDNDVLKFLDCPAGYFGNGCTEKCVLPSFGRACSDTCNCSFCHHVFGCILSSESKGIIKLIYNIQIFYDYVIPHSLAVSVFIILPVLSLLIIIQFCSFKDRMTVHVLFLELKCLNLKEIYKSCKCK